MKRTTRIGLAVALTGLLAAPPLLADDPGGLLSRSIAHEAARLAAQATSEGTLAWERVHMLSPGTSLVVTTVGPTSRTGAFINADASALRIDIRGQLETIDRGDILSITIPKSGLGGYRLVAGLLGATAGGFVGYALGYDQARGEKGIYRAVYFGVPLGIGAGAVAGALAGGRPAKTIYVSHRIAP
jgi:hypothetical protein